MKKWMAVILALALTAGVLAGCGGNKVPPVVTGSESAAASGSAEGEKPVEGEKPAEGEKPVEGEKAEYTIDYQLSTTQGAGCWIEGADGFYYWTSPVLSYDEDADNCYTGVLINSCKAKNSKTIGTGADEVTYYLTVEIIGSGIQSVPTTVVTEEWSSGVSGVSDAGILSIKQQGGAGN